MERFFINEMTTEEVKKALEKTDMAIVPFGSTEQHSKHLPLGTDSIITYEITKKVGEKINKEFPVMVAPLVSIGKSIEHMAFNGTITFQRETLANIKAVFQQIKETSRSETDLTGSYSSE